MIKKKESIPEPESAVQLLQRTDVYWAVLNSMLQAKLPALGICCAGTADILGNSMRSLGFVSRLMEDELVQGLAVSCTGDGDARRFVCELSRQGEPKVRVCRAALNEAVGLALLVVTGVAETTDATPMVRVARKRVSQPKK